MGQWGLFFVASGGGAWNMETIHKRSDQVVRANLKDYDAGRASFTWDAARALLAGLPGGGLNIAHEAIDRHVAAGLGDKVAIRWIAKDESRHDFTYADPVRRPKLGLSGIWNLRLSGI